MTISELIDTEDIEPETIRYFLPDLPEEDIEWVLAARVIKHSTIFLEDMFAFENVIRALNKLPVDFSFIQGLSPKHIWYGMDVIERLWDKITINYSWEVQKYIQSIFNNCGIYGFYPFDKESIQKYMVFAKRLLDPNDTSVSVESSDEIQSQRLAEILVYATNKKEHEHQ